MDGSVGPMGIGDSYMERIGSAATGAVARLTGSDKPSTKSRTSVAISDLKAPATEEEARALRKWAEKVDDSPIPATVEEIARHFKFLNASLPTRATSVEDGRKRAAVYISVLQGYSNEALAYMARRAIETLQWLPTPSQCLAILKDWREPTSVKDHAIALCARFWQERMETFLAALEDGSATMADVEQAQERWRRIAEDRGLLRRLDDGSLVIRSKWHGPRKAAGPKKAEKREIRRYCTVCMFSSWNPATLDCAVPQCGLRDHFEARKASNKSD